MIDFIDFGCGTGGSIEWAKARFGGKTHLGIDNRIDNVKKATDKGYNVILANVEEIELPQCRYITMLHFLEHLKNEQIMKNVIEKAIKSAKEFIFIKVPFFDAKEYLKTLDFKLTWTDWIGHPIAVTTQMLKDTINSFNYQSEFGYSFPILNSESDEVIPLSSPVDVIRYDKKLGEKKHIEFNNVFREMYCFVNINCSNFEDLKKKL